MGDIYLNGSVLAGGKKVKFNGSDMANVYFNGTKIWTEYTPTANTYTSNATEQLNDNLSQITIEIAGAGGGGSGASVLPRNSSGSAGGTTYVYVKQANGTIRTTFSASGGAAGAVGSVGGNTGGNGQDFGTQGNIGNYTGGAGSTHTSSPAYRPSGGNGQIASGGGGNGYAGSSSSGGGGSKGSYYTTTYNIVDVTDYLEIVIGVGGAGGDGYSSTPGDNGTGGAGGNGIVRTIGIV